jgi:hypothetical protein
MARGDTALNGFIRREEEVLIERPVGDVGKVS